MERTDQSGKGRSHWKTAAIALSIVWVGFLGYLLLASDPPDLWFGDIGTVDGPGHLVGGVVTGAGAYVLLARHRRAVLLALGCTLALLLGLEFVQDRFTGRGYETSDVVLSAAGAVIGVGIARLGHVLMKRSAERRR
jgi:hypothetical protein